MTYSDAGKYFRRFFMEDEINNCKIYRLHLSHDDSDGYGCQVLIELVRNICNSVNDDTSYEDFDKNDNPVIHYRNCSAGKENIEKAIKNYIHDIAMERPVYYRRGIDKILILITDLGSFDSEFLYKLREAGHNISCIYIDHHLVNTSLLSYFTDEDYYHTFEDMGGDDKGNVSSTLQIFNILFELPPINNDRVISLDDYSYTVLKNYTVPISEYDTGHWDNNWNITDSSVAENIVSELLFASYEDKTEYFLDMVEYHSLLITSNMSACSKNRSYLNLLNRYKDLLYGNILHKVEREKDKFISSYNEFLKHVRVIQSESEEFYSTYPLNKMDFGKLLNFKILFMENETDTENPYKYFSLYSRRVLANYSRIYDCNIIFIFYDKKINVCKLRALSKEEGGINVHEIARANGGGGHYSAAGFPVLFKE